MSAATLFGEIGLVDKSNLGRSDVLGSGMEWRLQDGGLVDTTRNCSLGECQTLRSDLSMGTSFVPKRHAPVARPTKVPTKLAEEVRPRAKWLGYVTNLLDDGFSATFQSDEGDKKAIVAEFDIDELSVDDRPLLKEGAQLVWAVFTERRRGTQENGSVLYIRRIPQPIRTAIQAAEDNLEQWFGHLNERSRR